MVTPAAQDDGNAVFLTKADPALVKALAWTFRYQRLLDEGQYASISEMDSSRSPGVLMDDGV